jgi:hypothetical protein
VFQFRARTQPASDDVRSFVVLVAHFGFNSALESRK